MKELEGLISLGKAMRTTSAHRGGLINLVGDTALIINQPRSLIMRIQFERKIGMGNFYAGEAEPYASADEVEQREEVSFNWFEPDGTIKRSMLPNRTDLKVEMINALSTHLVDREYIKIPFEHLDKLDSDILTTRTCIKDNNFYLRQLRSDGERHNELEIPLNPKVQAKSAFSVFGIKEEAIDKVSYSDTEEVTVFTADLYIMRKVLTDFQMSWKKSLDCLAIRGVFDFGAKFEGIIAPMIYEY